MDVINGMPAHALLLHFALVLVPLTAALEIVCAVWPAARRGQTLWLTALFAVATLVLTLLTVNAGQWLYDRSPQHSPIVREHASLGSTMNYVAAALLAVAVALVALRVVERRSDKRRVAARLVVAILALAVGIPSMVQIYRVGDAGARAVWGDNQSG